MKARSSPTPFAPALLASSFSRAPAHPRPRLRRPASEAHRRAHQLRALRSRGRCRAASSGTRTGSGSPSCAARARRSSLHALDVTTGETSLLLDGAKVMMPGEKPKPLPLATASWLPDGHTLLVPAAGDVFTVDARTAAVRALVQTPETEEYAEASPDGTRVAFVRKSDLWVVDVATGRETRLTQGGSETLLNGRLDWVYEEELASRSGQAFVWSPDSRAIAYLQLDQSRVPTFPIVDFLPVRNEVEWQRYPKAGAPNAIVRVGVIGLDRDGTPGPERLVSFTPDDVYVLPQLGWTPDSRQVAFQHLNRAQNELELRLLPVPSAPREPLGDAAHGAHRALEDLAQHLRRAALPEGRAALPVALRARRLRPRLRLRRRRPLPGGDAGPLDGGRPGVVHGRRPRARARRAQRLPLLHRHREGPARAAPVPRPPRRHRPHPPHPRGRHAPHRDVSPTAASTPTPGRTSRPRPGSG